MIPKIVLAHPVHDDLVKRLERTGPVFTNSGPEPLSSYELAEICKDASALMAFMTERIDADFLDRCPNLRIVAGALKGFDNIDVEACSKRGIAVSIVPDLLTAPTAELAVAMMISAARNFVPAEKYVRNGNFKGWRPTFFGKTLTGATVGVIGAGKLGQAVLKLIAGFGGERLYNDFNQLPEASEREFSAVPASIKEICRKCDFVVLALPLTKATEGLVDRAFLEDMKPEAFLINPARGSLVDESEIADALESGQLAGYAADVFEFEDWARPDRPTTIEPRLLSSEKTVLTPHVGSAVAVVRQQIVESAAESIEAFLQGKCPDTVINKEAVV